MAIRVSELSEIPAIQDTSLVYISSGGMDYKMEWADLVAALGGYPAGTKFYRATLTQTGTSAPVATVLQNTLGGTLVWSYSTVGEYIATLAGAFPNDAKLAINLINTNISVSSAVAATGSNGDGNSIYIDTFISTTGGLSNGVLTNSYIEIIVFP